MHGVTALKLASNGVRGEIPRNLSSLGRTLQVFDLERTMYVVCKCIIAVDEGLLIGGRTAGWSEPDSSQPRLVLLRGV